MNGRSVASAIRKYLALRSPYLKKQIRYDLQSTLRNSTTNELCDKVKSRGGVGRSKPVQRLTKVTMEVNWCMQLGTFFFPSLKASGGEETKKNWKIGI